MIFEKDICHIFDGNKRLLKLFKESSSLVSINELETGEYIDVNEVFLNTTGFSIHEVLGKNPLKMGLVVNCKEKEKIFKELNEIGHVRHYEIEIIDKEGNIHIGMCSSDIIEVGRDKYVLTVMTDLTTKFNYEENLRDSEEKFRALFEKSPAGILLSNENGEIIEWNHVNEELIGIKRGDVLGRYVWDIQFKCLPEKRRSEETYKRIKKIMMNALQTGCLPEANKSFEGAIVNSKGEKVYVSTEEFIIKTSKGYMLCAYLKNLTEKKRNEEEAARTNIEISMLYDLFSKASQHIETSELLKVAQKTIMEMLNIDVSTVHLYNKEKDSLSVNCVLGASNELSNSIKLLKSVDELTGAIIKTKKPMFLKTENYPNIAYKYLLQKEGIKSVWLFPIIFSGEILGLLSFGSKSDRNVDSREMQFVEMVCNQLAMLVRNTLLYDETRSKLEEKKKLERRLLENETRFKLASEGARIALWDWNLQDNCVILDERWSEIMGYTISDQMSIDFGKLSGIIHPEDLNKSSELLKLHFSGDTDYYESEKRIKHKNGDWIWILDRGKVIERDINNNPIRMTGTYIDITQKKKAEEIEMLLIEKEKEESVKNEFFANISHELRTPVNVIYAAIQLESKYIPNLDMKQIIKYNNTIKQNCLRLIRIINNIIDITRIETGFFKPEFRVENIVNLVENITMSIISYAEVKHINVVFDTEFEELYVKCDASFMERIILNLLSNSVKNLELNGNIEVKIYKESDNWVTIGVKDNGIGIPESLQQKIFERFQRVDKSMSRNAEGSGIGLSLVKSLLEIQNGTISLKSNLNEGAEFSIKLPLVEKYDEIYVINEQNEIKTDNHIIEMVNIEFSDIYT